MWRRLVTLSKQNLGSPIQIFKRLQSSTQYYPINDDVYGFTDDQKQVSNFCLHFINFRFLIIIVTRHCIYIRSKRISTTCQ